MKKVPDFNTLDEAVHFWEEHDSADFWESMESVEFDVELRRNLLTDRPFVLAHRPVSCPRCGAELEDTVIDYLLKDHDHLLMISDLPVLRCQGEDHLYLLEETYDRLQQLVVMERHHQIEPTSTLTIPVFSLVSG